MAHVEAEYARAVQARQALEQEMEALAAELTTGGNPGLRGPLVDADGFPRADVDVLRVRQLRHSLALKRTDHARVTRQIEALLPQVFAARGAQPRRAAEPPTDAAAAGLQKLEAEWQRTLRVVAEGERQLQPFAEVQSVETESPAEAAGLQARDQVLRFGSADAANHRQLAAVRDIVQRNVGSGVRVLVRRGQEVLALELTPRAWRGPGVLGCLLQPL